MELRVLVACECSGRVRDAFAARGWETWSADLLPSENPPHITVSQFDHAVTDAESTTAGNHYQGDARDLFNWNHPVNTNRAEENHRTNVTAPAPPLWDLIIAHPPCTDLSYAGARWFKEKQADGRQAAAAAFFMEMVNSPSPLVAVENPHSIMQKLYRPPDEIVQPWMFGDPFTKGIHLWLKGLPPLVASYSEAYYPGLFRAATGGGSWRTDKKQMRDRMSQYEDSEGRANRAKVRSRTFQGFAQAMADQWGKFAEGYYRDLGRI
jgi:site-specific DNA-cytosine methylase